ncbi:hypothetical protein [Nocardioides nanhaiensis]|uniref:Phage tail tape measure protein n=1 Tax=Nocardioides nanhaiensis TaxID=1476871 RepID=A0ABP8X179_9ACTN
MGQRFSRAGALIRSGLTIGAVGAGVLGKAIVTQASDAQQSLGATESVYGRYANTVIRQSKNAADAVGLSANEYRELANVTGAMLKSSGLPLKEVTTLTADLTGRAADLTGRAADLAATYGGTTREAIEAVSSLLRGEADPIEAYGVSIKQADVNARLAAKGLDELEGSARKQAEQQARIELLFRQSADAAGQFGRESDTLAGQSQRLKAELQDTAAEAGTALLPSLTDLVKYGRSTVVPWLGEAADWLATNSDEIGNTASQIGSALLPSLKAFADVGGTVLDVITAIPEPVRNVAAQVGIAGFAWAKLSPVVIDSVGALGEFSTKVRDAETRAAAIGRVSRQAAGVGGLLAFAAGAQQTDSTMGTLLTTLGGAATGFAIGGPIGGAVGALAGLTTGLLQSRDAADDARTSAEDYAAALDQVTGAATEQNRAMILTDLQQAGTIDALRGYGISAREAVNAALGQADATERVNLALQGEEAQLQANRQALADVQREYANLSSSELEERGGALIADEARIKGEIDTIRNGISTLREVARQHQDTAQSTRAASRATTDYSALIGKIPKRAYTRIDEVGLQPTARGVARLTRQYNLQPKEVRTVITTLGIDTSVKNVRRLAGQLDGVGKKKPKSTVEVNTKGAKGQLDSWLSSLGKSIRSGVREADRGGNEIKRGLEKGPKGARADLGRYKSDVSSGVASARSTASSGGQSVGNALQSGVLAGFAGTQSALAAQAAAAVRAAVASAKAAAKIKSPSRVMRDEVGAQLGRGLELGIADRKGKAKNSGRNLIRSLLSGVDDGADGISKSVDRLTKLIEKRVKGKGEEKRERAILKSLSDEFKQLRKNGAQQEKNNRLLVAARQRHKDLVAAAKQYGTEIRDSFVQYGSVTALGQGEGFGSLEQMFQMWEARAEAAERFGKNLLSLASAGLSRTVLEDIRNAGVEGGAGIAEALLAGGREAIGQANSLADRFAQVGGGVGDKLRDRYHSAGIASADALVRQLERQQAKLDRIAQRMGRELVKEAQRAIGGRPQPPSARETYARSQSARQQAGAAPQRLHLTAQELDQLQRGRQISRDLRAWERAGGTR